MAGRFPLLTDENVSAPVIEGLAARGWDVLRAIELFGQKSIDDTIFAYAAEHGRVLASSDTDCLAIAHGWLQAGRFFRLIYWHQGRHQHTPVALFLDAFEALTASADAFAACVEYLKLDR